MRRSIWIPAGVCKSQSIAAEASRTINEPHALRELRRLYPGASVLVHAVSDVRATLPRSGVRRSRAFPRASSPKATSRSSQPGPSKHDAVCPERFVPGSSLPCLQHNFMCGTCQLDHQPHRRSLDDRTFPTLVELAEHDALSRVDLVGEKTAGVQKHS